MISQAAQPKQWRKAVTTTARPISEIVRSSSNTTYTKITVADGSAWTLSAVAKGDILKIVDAVTGDIFWARVLSVNDVTDTITIDGTAGWIKAAASGRGKAAMVPSAGSVCQVHHIDKCTFAVIDGIDSNSAYVYLGFDDTVTVAGGANPGHPISNNPAHSNYRLELEIGLDLYLDLTSVYVIAASSQELSIIVM